MADTRAIWDFLGARFRANTEEQQHKPLCDRRSCGAQCHPGGVLPPIILRAISIVDLCNAAASAAKLHYSDGVERTADDLEALRSLWHRHELIGGYTLVEVAYRDRDPFASYKRERFQLAELRQPWPDRLIACASALGISTERLAEIIRFHADPSQEMPLPSVST